jgi:(E)-4-hydroxy-3-methylbut-2-enyl-diphosphate synthase
MSKSNPKSLFITKGYTRKQTVEVSVGGIAIGGDNPIRVQTMTTTNTNNIEQTVEQTQRTIKAGAELVRITTQGLKEVESLAMVKQTLHKNGVEIPLIADIHFNPRVALAASIVADKIRVNPGNYSDKSRASTHIFSAVEYESDLKIAEEQFVELIESCKKHNTTMRIGVNHGSLSKRIMDRFGDTPAGMAESAMEFARICSKNNYSKVVLSMKSSNTRVMVQATRYLVNMMEAEGLNYPMHLGVTEAGEGEDGRIKSAVGIGALLVDGIGDTIRVSLTEEPENEIPVAQILAHLFDGWGNTETFTPTKISVNPFEYSRRETKPQLNIGGNNAPVVIAQIDEPTIGNLASWGWQYNSIDKKWEHNDSAADYILVNKSEPSQLPNTEQLPLIGRGLGLSYSLINVKDVKANTTLPNITFLEIDADGYSDHAQQVVENNPDTIIILQGSSQRSIYAIRNILFDFAATDKKNPCIVSMQIDAKNSSDFQIIAPAITGVLFIDGLADGILLQTSNKASHEVIRDTSFGILQAARVRMTKTEFISCPGCGRTLYNLNTTLQKVKQRLSHLKGLKIGVMGCIVNGPGEMADAEYGYVGSGPGKVTLYYRKEVVKKNIPEENAVDELVAIIKANGDWIERE